MKHKDTILIILSVLFIIAGIYFHYGFLDLVNDYIYSDDKIPTEFKGYDYYFMNEKLNLKNNSAAILFVLSIILLVIGFLDKKSNKIVKGILIIQLIVVFFSIFRWLMLPAGILW